MTPFTLTPPTPQQRLAERLHPEGRGVMQQRWENLLFLHWRWDAAEVQRSLPAGLTVDTFNDFAWLGLVPVFMRDVRPNFIPSIPTVSDFLELNLRTYVYDAQGRPGLYFYSLDCDQPLVVEAARRLLHLRYEHAIMSGEAGGLEIEMTSQRVGHNAIDRFRYHPYGSAVEPEPETLAFFLIERYRLFANAGNELLSIRVNHAPHRIRFAQVSTWGAATFPLAGFTPPDRDPDHVCMADPVHLEVFAPERVTPV
jgi:uncharacterized protein YqjF (DUF2071 family)